MGYCFNIFDYFFFVYQQGNGEVGGFEVIEEFVEGVDFYYVGFVGVFF